jgi:hypothetical protein
MRKILLFTSILVIVCSMLFVGSINVQPISASGSPPCIFPTPLPGTGYAIWLTQSSSTTLPSTNVTFKASMIGGNWGGVGHVYFVDNRTALAKIPVYMADANGVVSFSTTQLAVGTHSISAYLMKPCHPLGDMIDPSVEKGTVVHNVVQLNWP